MRQGSTARLLRTTARVARSRLVHREASTLLPARQRRLDHHEKGDTAYKRGDAIERTYDAEALALNNQRTDIMGVPRCLRLKAATSAVVFGSDGSRSTGTCPYGLTARQCPQTLLWSTTYQQYELRGSLICRYSPSSFSTKRGEARSIGFIQ